MWVWVLIAAYSVLTAVILLCGRRVRMFRDARAEAVVLEENRRHNDLMLESWWNL